jgi:selenide,water dikinase
MVLGSGVGAILNADAVPIIPEAWEFARQDVVPGGTRRNLAGLEGKIVWGPGIDDVDRLVLADAQTSGGLLIAVPADRADRLHDELVRLGALAASDIGTIVEGDRIVVEHSS